MDRLLQFLSITRAYKHRWYPDAAPFAVIGHYQILGVFAFSVITYQHHYSAKFLNILSFDNKMALAPINQYYRLMTLLDALTQVLVIKVSI